MKHTFARLAMYGMEAYVCYKLQVAHMNHVGPQTVEQLIYDPKNLSLAQRLRAITGNNHIIIPNIARYEWK